MSESSKTFMDVLGLAGGVEVCPGAFSEFIGEAEVNNSSGRPWDRWPLPEDPSN